MLRAAVMGASGYTGGELLRILSAHPNAEVSVATSRKYSGESVYRVHPNLRGLLDLEFSENNVDEVLKKADIVFTALPHGGSIKIVPELAKSGIKVIDLSADFRLKKTQLYKEWYGFEHAYPDLLKKSVYGVPELRRQEIQQAKLVSCPGCMAVTALLALLPVLHEAKVDTQKVVVDAKIGSSGSGNQPKISTHHPERFGVVRPYNVEAHRHCAEIEQELALLAGKDVRISMTPHAVNMVRGILCSIYLFYENDLSDNDVWRMYRKHYDEEPFIRMIKDRKGLYRFPDPKMVVGSNFCDIGFAIDQRARRLVLFSASDNLVKGAAGSAVQCMNIMEGFSETDGLKTASLHPA